MTRAIRKKHMMFQRAFTVVTIDLYKGSKGYVFTSKGTFLVKGIRGKKEVKGYSWVIKREICNSGMGLSE